ncbi:MAG: hypothetical protein U1D06_14580 [Paracoccaceae bacterium]|nr:hypothetical protein [Paracoccaceae bacterium]
MADIPLYRPDMPDADLKSLLEDGPVTLGSLDDLAHFAARLEALGEWVHSSEVVALDGPRPALPLGFSLMGLDGEDDWDIPLEPARMRALLAGKIAAMRSCARPLQITVWMGESAE